VFQVDKPGPVEAFLPVMLFAILFGLSMDYEVFLISRIQEEWLKSGDNRIAVRNGLAATGKTITAAALIMILVFGSFILGGIRVIKEFGLGLAGGIFVDAFLIRMAVVPALMFLSGKGPSGGGSGSTLRQSQLVVPRVAGPDPAPPQRRSRTTPGRTLAGQAR
jgi:RND superfamily putative drug exporter